MKLLVGLGNPGRKYELNRHNIGFLVLDAIADKLGATWTQRYSGEYAKVFIGSATLHLLKPQTYMNLSGESVHRVADFFNLEPESVWIVHDDVDLPYETVRVKVAGGHGGHNGLRDLVRVLGNRFNRVRVGVGRSPHGRDTSDHVLGNFSKDEQISLEQVIDRCVDIALYAQKNGPRKAMNEFNGRELREVEAETVH